LKLGVFGAIAAFSFYPTKNLGALGDGGVLTTSTASLAARLASLRQYGWRERYHSEEVGMNSRLDELQAAILRVKLPHLDARNQRRQAIASAYDLSGRAIAIVCRHNCSRKELAPASTIRYQCIGNAHMRDVYRSDHLSVGRRKSSQGKSSDYQFSRS